MNLARRGARLDRWVADCYRRELAPHIALMLPSTSTMHGLFITGTDTGVGKTCVAGLIVRAARAAGVRVGAFKPACSGAELAPGGLPVWEDVERLSQALGGDVPSERICPQRFLAPLAPPAAAHVEGRSVDRDVIRSGVDWWCGRAELLVVEGAGGWLCPLTDDATMADFAVELGFPVVVVAANRLGTINHTLLTLEAIALRGLPVAAVVLSDVTAERDASAESNPELLTHYADGVLWGTLPHGGDAVCARGRPLTGLDWLALAQSRTVGS